MAKNKVVFKRLNDGFYELKSSDDRFYIYKDYVLRGVYVWSVGEIVGGENHHLESFDYLKEARQFVLDKYKEESKDGE